MTFTSSDLPHHERGLEFGERHSDRIASTVAAYRRLFATRADHPFDVDLWAERAWDTITRVAPTHADEILGIAEGAYRFLDKTTEFDQLVPAIQTASQHTH